MRHSTCLPVVGSVMALWVLAVVLPSPAASTEGKATPAPGAKSPVVAPGGKGAAAPVKVKPVQWRTDFTRATVEGQKADKLILMYVSGSDWDDFTKKLEKDVMGTKVFTEWVEKNVIPVQVDFAKDKQPNGVIKAQNAKLRTDFSLSKVPTFLFIDTSGEVIARCGYDTAKLRDNEKQNEPKAWMDYLDAVLKSRPPPENLNMQKTLKEGVTSARKHGVPLLIMITQKPTDALLKEKEAILKNQQFIRFINRNMAFTTLEWPEDYDKSPDAEYARKFVADWKIGPGPLKLALWDPGGLGSLKAQPGGISAANLRFTIRNLDALLPKIDYNGGWIEDWKLARAIAIQQKKDIFVGFVSSSATADWTKTMDTEIFQTPQFRQYAHDNLVLLKVDFPANTGTKGFVLVGQATTAPTTSPTTRPTTGKSPTEVKEMMVTGPTGDQPPQLKDQNKMLADMYGVRGYPTIVLLNPLGQKIGDAKYIKGGVSVFMKELDNIRKQDSARRFLFSEQEAAKQ